MSINQKRSLKITRVKSFGVLLYRQDIFHTVRRHHMIVIDKKHYECQTIDFAMPYDTGVDDKDAEEIEKYLDLARELKKVWNMKVTVVLLVAGVLCTPIKALQKRLETIGIETKITELQKTFSIHTSRILRRVHEVWDVLLTSFLKKKTYPLVESTCDHSIRILIITIKIRRRNFKF